jgi:glycosyltransferase involved in cell wall biosynthesis
MDISVIICSHNPRPDYLQRVLDALKAQTLPKEQWELLLIDNASKEPLAGQWDLSWHPRARHIQEEELGLTPARLRGIKESQGDLLVFVDDDNIIAPDYLQQALKIAGDFPFLGAWCGRIDPEFEVEPPEWSRRFWSYLALRQIQESYWSNIKTDYSILPCGAGLCVRKNVAEIYAQKANGEIHSRSMDRKGQLLTSCGDTDLALTACNLHQGYGLFAEMKLLHLIPKERLTEDYLLRLEEGIAYSSSLLRFLRSLESPRSSTSSFARQYLGKIRRRLTMKRLDRLVLEARLRGWNKANEEFAKSTQS